MGGECCCGGGWKTRGADWHAGKHPGLAGEQAGMPVGNAGGQRRQQCDWKEQAPVDARLASSCSSVSSCCSSSAGTGRGRAAPVSAVDYKAGSHVGRSKERRGLRHRPVPTDVAACMSATYQTPPHPIRRSPPTHQPPPLPLPPTAPPAPLPLPPRCPLHQSAGRDQSAHGWLAPAPPTPTAPAAASAAAPAAPAPLRRAPRAAAVHPRRLPVLQQRRPARPPAKLPSRRWRRACRPAGRRCAKTPQTWPPMRPRASLQGERKCRVL